MFPYNLIYKIFIYTNKRAAVCWLLLYMIWPLLISPLHLILVFPSLSPPIWPPFYSLNTPGTNLPQDLHVVVLSACITLLDNRRTYKPTFLSALYSNVFLVRYSCSTQSEIPTTLPTQRSPLFFYSIYLHLIYHIFYLCLLSLSRPRVTWGNYMFMALFSTFVFLVPREVNSSIHICFE